MKGQRENIFVIYYDTVFEVTLKRLFKLRIFFLLRFIEY